MNTILAELLAPAGSYDCLRAAINAGCDAVYVGGSFFGARAYADNFDTESMKKAIDYVHIHDKKIYLTVNTLLKNNELEDKLYEYLYPFYIEGLDAVIVQDMGVFKYIHDVFPDLHIHASTQMTVTGVDGAKLLKSLGATRVVTARELSLDELKAIHNEVDIEIESFVHGALCYGYSGQCLLSSILGGRSGNRGRCAQPCRLPYDAILPNNKVSSQNEKYLLSTKDMCTIDILPDIIKSGVYSLKIEGRMKSPEYVSGVVEIYRKYLDKILLGNDKKYKVSEKDYNNLTQLYSRNGFSTGYYNQHNGKNMISLSSASYNSVSKGRTDELKKKYVDIDNKIPINIYAYIKQDSPITITFSKDDIYVTVEGTVPDKSLNRPATYEDVKKQLVKLGDTPFSADNFQLDMDNNLFIPNKILNELRRKSVMLLNDKLLCNYRRRAFCPENSDINKDITIQDSSNTNTGTNTGFSERLICSVDTMKQFNVVNRFMEVDEIYISSDSLSAEDLVKCIKMAHDNNKKIYITMPFIFRKNAKEYFDNIIDSLIDEHVDGFIVKNIDELSYILNYNIPFICDYSMYSMNDNAKSFLNTIGALRTTIQLELNKSEIINRNNTNDELIIYGYYPLMISAGCIKKTLDNCNHNMESFILKDRYNKEFTVKSVCRFCYNVIYNIQPTSLLKTINNSINVNNYRLNFTIEDEVTTKAVINKFVSDIKYNKDSGDIDNYTRGHFKRGVE